MEVLSNSSYPSGTSGDSLKEAFASLDAASLERKEYSLGSIDSLSSILKGPAAGQQVRSYLTDQHSPTLLLRARRRQDNDDQSSSLRPLCGGATLQEMEEEVKKRAAIDRSIQRHWQIQPRNIEGEAATLTKSHHDDNAGPSFRAFPMSMAEEDIAYNDSPEEVTMSNPLGYTADHVEEISPPAPSLAVDQASTSQTTKKRTMQWAAKRNRRIARRRDEPPLTRSQARQRSILVEIAPSISIGSHDITAEITDPSIGGDDDKNREMVGVAIPPIPKRQKRKKKDTPALPLTYTEPEEAVKVPLNQESGESSLTESESSQILLYPNNRDERASRYGVAGPAPLKDDEVDSSDTEEEEAEQPAIKKRQMKAMPDLEEESRKKAKSREMVKVKAQKSTTTTKSRIASTKIVKGSNLFNGLTFLLFGFWSQVKLFEKLIEKHGGSISKGKSYDEIRQTEKIDYLLSCTHSGHKPTPTEIGKWKSQMIDAKEEHLFQVNQVFNTTPMIQADWISECIAKCLRKEDLLSVERHRISVA